MTTDEYDEYIEAVRVAELRVRARGLFYRSPVAEEVDAVRKAAIARRDDMMALQRQMGGMRETEWARFFKREAQEALKDYRGACLVLGHLAPGGDAPFVRTNDWPLELIPHAERAVA